MHQSEDFDFLLKQTIDIGPCDCCGGMTVSAPNVHIPLAYLGDAEDGVRRLMCCWHLETSLNLEDHEIDELADEEIVFEMSTDYTITILCDACLQDVEKLFA